MSDSVRGEEISPFDGEGRMVPIDEDDAPSIPKGNVRDHEGWVRPPFACSTACEQDTGLRCGDLWE
ncbi:MAG: hypothetical protein CYG60_08020 [Actinobacteria bacterium]|nr:hypothetical protein [Actinomycetota bacterium]PLS86268.1 MAG: hypothetical protein CYG60_08020 [Actinomycetota bacterium]